MNRVAIVTGGTSGIGLATAQRAAGCGRDGLRRSAAIAAALEGLHSTWFADVSDEAADRAPPCREVHAREGRIDILVNNAGLRHLRRGGIHRQRRRQTAAGREPLRHGQRHEGGARADAARSGSAAASSASAPSPRRCPFPSRPGIPSPRPPSAPIPSRCSTRSGRCGVSVCAIMPGDIHTGFTAARDQERAAATTCMADRIARSVAKMEKRRARAAWTPPSPAAISPKSR